MSSPRLKIRCPNCHKDGSARAELINRRVSCKHCAHVFRVVPIEAEAPAKAEPTRLLGPRDFPEARTPPGPPTDRIASLELEIRQLREHLSAEHVEAVRVQALREQLAQAFDSARQAEGREQALREEVARLRERADQALPAPVDAPRDGLREEELKFLRDQLDRARAEVESESRKRREAAGSLAARVAEHAQALEAKEAEHADALASRQAEHAGAVEALGSEHERSIASRQAEHAEALRVVVDQLERARAEARAVEARRLAADSARGQAEGRQADEILALREELDRARRDLEGAREALEALRLDRDRLEADHGRVADDLRWQLADIERRLGEADEARDHRDRLVGEEVARERDEARDQLGQALEEIEGLRARLEQPEGMSRDWSYASTEVELPSQRAGSPPEGEVAALMPETSTVFDGGPGRPEGGEGAELATLRARLAEAGGRLARMEADLERAEAEAGDVSRRNLELAERVQALEGQSVPDPAVAPSAIEADRDRAVDAAVKGAWADFERRLAETQAKLKAANARADLMEIEAREAREMASARERGLDDDSSFDGTNSMTSIRILDARGNARLTVEDAEARLALAKQLAVDRKDKALIDRVGKMAEKVRGDLASRNYTLAETLVRGAEIEAGLDPGGFSIAGLRIFRPSPTVVASLSAMAPALDRVMAQEDPSAIRSTIDELRTILGDQAGLPEIRRVGRAPAVKRPIAEGDALRLFLDALAAENWLMRPVAAKKPLPDTSLTTYACLIEACADARRAAERLEPGRVGLLDGVIQASGLMLARRQQADGHFSFLDPRGGASKPASAVEAMVARRPESVKDGWVVLVDPLGIAQVETAACAVALSTAGQALGRPDWAQAAAKAADWAMGQPCLPNFVANAASAGLLARAYLDAHQGRHLEGLARKLTLGLLPGQVENGRWIDPSSATTPNHLAILRALHDAWEAIPADRDDLRHPLKSSIDRATASLLDECKALGVPPQGGALRDLLRHRDLFPTGADPRLGIAILDSATVVQELCHDGPRPRLGVAPDLLAALARA